MSREVAPGQNAYTKANLPEIATLTLRQSRVVLYAGLGGTIGIMLEQDNSPTSRINRLM